LGQITGFRVLNLRVRDKLAYPDLTIDLGNHGHVVIGLENGGGKSTLLGFLIHTFLPRADRFLPRLAHRRQHKQGEEKRIEHYVPGGDPTHVIVELQQPAGSSRRNPQPARVVVGACLHKKAGADPVAPAGEFFWSARCTTDELTLAHLGLRAQDGRLLDHEEWRTRLTELRKTHPAAEIVVHDHQDAWDRHLRDTLKVDVEFIKTWLLSMNQDEGAADHVFTYSSSREFLNSLIGAVADPQYVDGLKSSLTTAGADADKMRTDRRREALLRNLVAHTGPLAELTEQLTDADRERRTLTDALVVARKNLQSCETATQSAVEEAERHHKEATATAKNAHLSFEDAISDELAAQLQVQQLQLATLNRELEKLRLDEASYTRKIHEATAAQLLVNERTVRSRIEDIQTELQRKEADAEPSRLAASSALQAWNQRIEEEIDAGNNEHAQWTQRQEDADDAERRAHQRLLKAAETLARLDSEIKTNGKRLNDLAKMETEAASRGDLPEDTPATEAHTQAEQRIAALRSALADAKDRHTQHQRELDAVFGQSVTLQSEIAEAERAHAQRRQHHDHVTATTHLLEADLADSALVDLDPIRLDDHAELVLEVLHQASERATNQQLEAAVLAASARRAAQAITHTHLLPPRADITRVCEHAGALGVRPGWSYLANFDDDIAEQFATHHAALADGLVVNVPQDFENVVDLIREHRAELEGPVTVGLAEVFEREPVLEADSTELAVILPDKGFWSHDAAERQHEDRNRAHEQQQHTVEAATELVQRALQLRAKVREWNSEIGSGACDVAARELDDAKTRLTELTRRSEELDQRHNQHRQDRDAASEEITRLENELQADESRYERLTRLVDELGERSAIEQQRRGLESERDFAQADKDEASKEQTQARRDHQDAVNAAGNAKSKLAVLRQRRSAMDSQYGAIANPTDPIDANDAAADQQVLEQRLHGAYERWRGLVSDDQLRAELKITQEHVAKLNEELEKHEKVTLEAARTLLKSDPSRSADDFARQAEDAQHSKDGVIGEIGRVEQKKENAEKETRVAERAYRKRQPHQFSPDYQTEDLEHAQHIAETMLAARETAEHNKQQAQEEERRAEQTARNSREWLDLAKGACTQTDSHVSKLAAGGPLVKNIDVKARQSHLPDDAALNDAPSELGQLLARLVDRTGPTRTAQDLLGTAMSELAAEIETIRANLEDRGNATADRLDQVEAVLKSADDEIAKGDRLIQTLRQLPRSELAEHAATHHQAASQRHDAVGHYVAKFDQRVAAVARTTQASIRALLRAVSDTVKNSQLPETPAMGRWSGLYLLKLSGLDALNQEQQYHAILTTLQDWFAPDRSERPPFDADKTVWALVEACVPRFTARVLIPSDPLDSEHKQVETLARETSGGEGVTFALILASLLAARRASAHGHRRTSLLLDNPFSKVTKPSFLRLVRDVAHSLGVQITALTGIRDQAALTVFPALIQLRVSRRDTSNVVAPYAVDDSRLLPLLREGTLYVSAVEHQAATEAAIGSNTVWPAVSKAEVSWPEQIALDIDSTDPTAINPEDAA
jgi:hypothetical protein